MTEILHCKDICPLVAGYADRITRGENCISFERDIFLEDKTLIGHVGVSVRLNPKYLAAFTGLTVDENSPACTHLIRRHNFVLEQYVGMESSGVHKCKYLNPKLPDRCVTSYSQPAES